MTRNCSFLGCSGKADGVPVIDPMTQHAFGNIPSMAAHNILYAAFFLVAALIAYQDFRYRRVANRLLAVCFAGILLTQVILLPQMTNALRVGPITGGSVISSLLGTLVMVAFPLAYFAQQFAKRGDEAKGGGDVKSGALLGWLLGYPMAVHAAAVSVVVLGGWALAMGRFRFRWAARMWPFPYAGLMAVISTMVVLVPPGAWAGRW